MNKTLLTLALITQGNYLYSMMTLANPTTDITTRHYFGATSKVNVYLTLGTVYDHDGKATYLVVGEHEKQILKNPHYLINSHDDSYRPYDPTQTDSEESWFMTYGKNLNSKIITVKEPRIVLTTAFDATTQKNEFTYCYHKKNVKNDLLIHTFYKGDEAITHAAKDLEDCYKEILITLGNTTTKPSIALPTLGTATGFPRDKAVPIVVATILNFLTKYPKLYENIHVMIDKSSEFQLYQKLFDEELIGKK